MAGAFNLVPAAADALPAAVRRFVAMVQAHTGKPVLLQVGRAMEARYRLTAAIERPFWAIANAFPPAYAARPWQLWRALSIRRVGGIEGPVNWDVVTP